MSYFEADKTAAIICCHLFHVCFQIHITLTHEAFNNSGYTCELMYNCRMHVNSIIVSCTCWDSTKAYFKGKRFHISESVKTQLWVIRSYLKTHKSDLTKFTRPDTWWMWSDKKWLQGRAWPTACGLEPAPHPRTVLFDLSQDFWTKCAQRCWGKRDRGDFDFDLACKCW